MNRSTEPATNGERMAYLTFYLGQQGYAIPIEQVVEVAAMVELSTMPDTPSALLGVANRHGAVLPMLDLRQVFGKAVTPISPATLFIVAALGDQLVGLVVDEVHQVEYLQADKAASKIGSQRYVDQIISRQDRLIQVVALAAVLDDFLSREIDTP